MYNPNDYGSLQVTPIACGLEAQNGMIKERLVIHLHPSFFHP